MSDEDKRELRKVGVIRNESVEDRFRQFLKTFNADPQVKVHFDELKRIHDQLMEEFFTESDYTADWVEGGPMYNALVYEVEGKSADEITLAEWMLLNRRNR